MDFIELFKSGKLNKIARKATENAKKDAKNKGASIYYKLNKHWIREDAKGNKFIVTRNEKGEKTEVPFK